MVKKKTKTILLCTCELPGCGKSWESHGDVIPDRCRWCGRRIWNGQDLRKMHLTTAQGKTQHIAAWARETGLSSQTICARLKAGRTEEDAVSVPAAERKTRHANS